MRIHGGDGDLGALRLGQSPRWREPEPRLAVWPVLACAPGWGFPVLPHWHFGGLWALPGRPEKILAVHGHQASLEILLRSFQPPGETDS